MKTIKVTFLDSTHDYYTSVNPKASKESLEKYFVNQLFNTGIYPKEELNQCIGITLCNYYYFDENGFKEGFENLCMRGIYILKGFQDDNDRGKVTIRRDNALIPVCDYETGEQIKLEDLSDVIFLHERKKLGIDANCLCWTENENLYCFDNDDNLRLFKTIQEVDKLISQTI